MGETPSKFKDEAVEELERTFLERVRASVEEAIAAVKDDLANELHRPFRGLDDNLRSLREDFRELPISFRRELQSIKDALMELPTSNSDQMERLSEMLGQLSQTILTPPVLQRLWTATAVEDFPDTELKAGIVCFGGKTGLHVVDAVTGKQINLLETPSGVTSEIAFFEGIAFFGCYDGTLFAVDLPKCKEKWRRKVAAKTFNPLAAASGILCFSPGDSCLYGLDAATGHDLWQFTGEGRVFSRPVLLSGHLFVGCSTGRVHALDLKTGERRWTFDMKDFSCPSPILLGFGGNGSDRGNGGG